MIEQNAPTALNPASPAPAETAVPTSQPGFPAPESQTQTDDFAQRFSMLTRKERELREQHSKLKQQQERLTKFDEVERLAKDDPLAFLERFGLNYDQITQRLLNSPDAADPNARKLQELERRLAERDEREAKAAKEAEEKNRNELLNSARREVKQLVDSKPDEFELIRAQGKHDLVLEVQAEYYGTHEKWVDFETAAKWVEEHLEKEVDEEVERLLNLKKIQSRRASRQVPQAPGAQPPSPGTQAPKPGLSANHAPQMIPTSPGPVSDDELMARARQAWRAAVTR